MDRVYIEEAEHIYKQTKNDLRKLISASKKMHWKKLCQELEEDIGDKDIK